MTFPTAFRHAQISTGATNIGDGVLLVCWAWTASLLTRDALLIAAAPLMVRLGWLAFAVFAGVIADRFNRKRLILIADSFRFLLLAVFSSVVYLYTPFSDPATAGVSTLSVYVALLTAAAIAGMLEVVRDNAMQTIVPSIVPSDALEEANSDENRKGGSTIPIMV